MERWVTINHKHVLVDEDGNPVGDEYEDELNDIVSDKGFTSTTIVKQKLKKIKELGGVQGNILFKIKIAKGKGHGAYLPRYSHFGFEEEEFLLPRNQKFKINKINNNEIELETVY